MENVLNDPSTAKNAVGDNRTAATDLKKRHQRTQSRSESKYNIDREDGSSSLVRTIVPTGLEHDSRFGDAQAALRLRADKTHRYSNNEIHTTKYTILSFIPKNLFEQFHRLANVYFVFVALLNWVPAVEAVEPALSLVPVVIILSVTAIKDIIEDYRRYRNDKELNGTLTLVFCRTSRKYVKRSWKDIKVGDIILLQCNDTIPADLLLLRSSDQKGICFIETMNIDGETNLKQRRVVQNVCQTEESDSPMLRKSAAETFMFYLTCDRPHPSIDQFQGQLKVICDKYPLPDNQKKQGVSKDNFLLRGCLIRNTDYVEALVVYTGHDTKAMLNNNGPRMKRSKLERRMNKDILYCFAILIIVCTFAAIANNFVTSKFNKTTVNCANNVCDISLFYPPSSYDNSTGQDEYPTAWSTSFVTFWRMIVLLQILIPISLYVSIEIVKLFQIWFIQEDRLMYDPETDKRIQCRAMNITEDLGQIEYVFSDKTGTLTENKMVFKRCTINGVDYPHGIVEGQDPRIKQHRKNIKSNTSRRKSSNLRAHHRRGLSTASRKSISAMTDRSPVHSLGAISMERINTDMPPGTAANPEDELETVVEVDELLNAHLLSINGEAESFENLHGCDDNSQDLRVLEFFTCLTICNTVVMSEENLEEIEREQARKKEAAEADVKAKSKNKGKKALMYLKNTMSKSRSDSIQPSGTPGRGGARTPENITIEELNRIMADKLSNFGGNSSYVQSDAASGAQTPTIEDDSNTLLGIPEVATLTVDEMISGSRITYEAESPDEAALVYASQSYKCHLLQRSPQSISIGVPNFEHPWDFRILHVFPFNSDRKRMSIIVRHPKTDKIVVYTKGADSTILDLLRNPPDTEEGAEEAATINKTRDLLDKYARNGLRTLCIARKLIDERQYISWLSKHREAEAALEDRERLLDGSWTDMESDLELLGATGIEDRLQDDVPQTIQSLRDAGLRVWVITGDKVETAINIGHSCRLLNSEDKRIDLVRIRSRNDLKRKIQNTLDRIEAGKLMADNLDFYQFNKNFYDVNFNENNNKATNLRATKSVIYTTSQSKQLASLTESAEEVQNPQQFLSDHNLEQTEQHFKPTPQKKGHRRTRTVTFFNKLSKEDDTITPRGSKRHRKSDSLGGNVVFANPGFQNDESDSRSRESSGGNHRKSGHKSQQYEFGGVSKPSKFSSFVTSVVIWMKSIGTGSSGGSGFSLEGEGDKVPVSHYYPKEMPKNTDGEEIQVGLVVDGKTLKLALEADIRTDFLRLTQYCRTVLICRATPKQKGEVVKLVKTSLKVQTLAIGDGANDVSMIQMADIGVGISGLEGLQAVMNSDFAISKFRFLKRLLLVHGHWSYYRLSSMVLYFFYKNVSFVLIPFWFQFISGFAGANPIDDTILMTLNLLFNSLPPLIQGILDQDLAASSLMRHSNLYQQGVRSQVYKPRTFWIYWLLGCFQSIVAFWVAFGAYYEDGIDYLSIGWLATTSILSANLISQGIEFKMWTWIHWLCNVGSFGIYIAFSWLYCMPKFVIVAFTPSSFGIFDQLFAQGKFWLTVLVSVAACCVPHVFMRVLQNEADPSECQRQRVQERKQRPVGHGCCGFIQCCVPPS